ncbi:hypothetical protein WJX82_007318 [Trebouxia sp. C0006]
MFIRHFCVAQAVQQYSVESGCKLTEAEDQTSANGTRWTHQAVYNIPNALSMARLVSGPVIAWLILNEQWGVALVSLAISGASDWADGYVAKRFGQSSVLGSYLDPLADKVLIGSVVAALGYQGSLPLWLVSVIIGRDVVLLSGAFVHRFKMVGWRWPGAAEFFRVASSSPSAQPSTASNTTGHMQTDSVSTSEGSTETSSSYAENHEEALAALGVATGGTTLASCGAYARAYLSGTIK